MKINLHKIYKMHNLLLLRVNLIKHGSILFKSTAENKILKKKFPPKTTSGSLLPPLVKSKNEHEIF